MRAVTWVGRSWWIAVLVLAVGLVAPAVAADTERDRATLAGLTGVRVVVEAMKPDAEKDGLAASTLRTDVEVKLRLAGIRVLTETERLAAPGSPFLYVRVTTISLREVVPIYAVEALLDLHQEVMLTRDPTIDLSTPTWSTSWVGVAGSEALARMRQKVRDQVDKFINAFLAANPKR